MQIIKIDVCHIEVATDGKKKVGISGILSTNKTQSIVVSYRWE